MKKIIPAFLGIIFIVFIISCDQNGKKKLTDDTNGDVSLTEEETSNVLEEDRPDSVLIIGVWKKADKQLWLEFKSDGTFAKGKGKSVEEENMKYHLNADSNSITIHNARGIRHARYKLTKDKLQITFGANKRTIELDRIEKRPK